MRRWIGAGGALVMLAWLVMGCGPDPPADLEVLVPASGARVDAGPVRVAGRAPGHTDVVVDGTRVDVGADGTFETSIVVAGDYATIDVSAGDRHQRVAVLVGPEPVAEGVAGVRLGRSMIEGIDLGAAVDATGWAQRVHDLLPAVRTDLVTVEVTGLRLGSTEGGLEAGDALDARLALVDPEVHITVASPRLGKTVPVTLGMGRVEVRAGATPRVEDGGVLVADLSDPAVSMGASKIQVGDTRWWPVEGVVDLGGRVAGRTVELAAGAMTRWAGGVELARVDRSVDWFGQDVPVQLHDAWSQSSGLGLSVALGEGVEASPWSVRTHEGDVAIIVDERSLAIALDPAVDVLAAQAQGALTVAALPALGPNACAALDPGDARGVRAGTGDVLAVGLLPGAHATFGPRAQGCRGWGAVHAPLEVEVIAEGEVLRVVGHVAEDVFVHATGSRRVDEGVARMWRKALRAGFERSVALPLDAVAPGVIGLEGARIVAVSRPGDGRIEVAVDLRGF